MRRTIEPMFQAGASAENARYGRKDGSPEGITLELMWFGLRPAFVAAAHLAKRRAAPELPGKLGKGRLANRNGRLESDRPGARRSGRRLPFRRTNPAKHEAAARPAPVSFP
jgi:hypothetical protein